MSKIVLTNNDLFSQISSFLYPMDLVNWQYVSRDTKAEDFNYLFLRQMVVVQDNKRKSAYILKIIRYIEREPIPRELPLFRHVSSFRARDLTNSELNLLSLICPDLKELDIAESPLTEFRAISRLGALKKLSVKRIRDFNNHQLAHLANNRFEELNLWGTLISDEGLQYLSAMPLQKLNLRKTAVVGHGFVHFQHMPLHKLTLMSTYIGNASIAHLINLPLQKLDLRETTVAIGGLVLLRGKQMEKLQVPDDTPAHIRAQLRETIRKVK